LVSIEFTRDKIKISIWIEIKPKTPLNHPVLSFWRAGFGWEKNRREILLEILQ
jgi:hypothetical protein